jgi:putative DNA primase/helicase
VLFVVGPKRSGKGTILRTATNLVGCANVASTTFATLGESFGLENLLGKRMAIIPDGRLSGRTDTAAVVERLLSISGEDAQSVNRKNRRRITTKLRVRFVIASNEVPRLPDASGALASRFHILHTPNSWLGKEDRTLERKLNAELCGILKWAAEGWVRLQQQGAFTGNTAAEQYAEQLAELSSPIRAFVRDACSVGPEHQTEIPRLYQAWRDWNEQRHRECGSEATFGRDLKAACSHITVSQPRGEDGVRIRVYNGIGLRERRDWGVETSVLARDGTRAEPTHAWANSEVTTVETAEEQSKGYVGSARVPSRASDLLQLGEGGTL